MSRFYRSKIETFEAQQMCQFLVCKNNNLNFYFTKHLLNLKILSSPYKGVGSKNLHLHDSTGFQTSSGFLPHKVENTIPEIFLGQPFLSELSLLKKEKIIEGGPRKVDKVDTLDFEFSNMPFPKRL